RRGCSDDLLGKASIDLGTRSFLLAEKRKLVLLLAADTAACGHVLGGLTESHGVTGANQFWVWKTPTQSGISHLRHTARKAGLGFKHHQWSTSHPLPAAGNKDMSLAAPDSMSGSVDRLQARPAKPVDGLSRDTHR